MKTCTRCKIEKDFCDFGKCVAQKDGLNYICKECNRLKTKIYCSRYPEKKVASDKRYYQENKETIKNRIKRYEFNNKEKVKIAHSNYYQKNKERLDKANRQYVLKYPDIVRETRRKWAKRNPDKVKEEDRKRRAMKQNVYEYYTPAMENLTKQVFDNQCAVCEEKNNLHIDHFRPLSKGNPLHLLNACVLCQSCNCSKHTKDPEDFFEVDKLELINNRMRTAFNLYIGAIS
jgi:hypothetical protein